MIHVRRHQRVTVSGKTVTVTAHDREGGGGSGEIVRAAPEWSRPEYVGDLTPAADERGASPEFRAAFFDDDDVIEGEIWSDDEPEPEGTWYVRQGDEIWAVHPDGTTHPDGAPHDAPPDEPEGPTARCPECGGTFPVDVGGTLQGHRLDGPDYCPGSGSR